MSTPIQVLLRVTGLIAALMALAYAGYRLSMTEPETPCSTNGKPRRCYHVNENVCEISWAHAEEVCKEWVKKFNLPPGRLTGPVIHECQLATFDDAFAVSRKSNEECEQMFQELKDWRRSNM